MAGLHLDPWLAGRQRLTVHLNGSAVHESTLAAGWSEIGVPVPAALWRRGVNLVALEASTSDSPARMGGSDERDLSICVSGLRTAP